MIASSPQNQTDNYLDKKYTAQLKYIKINTLNKHQIQLTFSRPAVATNDYTCSRPKECSDKSTHGGAR